MTFDDHENGERNEAGPVIRDKRRIDPVTGELREPRDAAPGSPATPGDTGQTGAASDIETKLAADLAERTADLQRLQAVYVNY